MREARRGKACPIQLASDAELHFDRFRFRGPILTERVFSADTDRAECRYDLAKRKDHHGRFPFLNFRGDGDKKRALHGGRN